MSFTPPENVLLLSAFPQIRDLQLIGSGGFKAVYQAKPALLAKSGQDIVLRSLVVFFLLRAALQVLTFDTMCEAGVFIPSV